MPATQFGELWGWDLRNETTINFEEKESRLSYILEKLKLSSDKHI